MLKLKTLITFGILLAALTTRALALDPPTTYTSIEEHINNFSSINTINKDGTVDVTETIEYDFGPNSRHGIYRTIPYVKTNQEGKKFKLNFTNVTVTGENFVTTKENASLKIKIGDPDKTITGIKTYEIKYKVSGALTYFSDHDELYWNITGNEWDVPISNAETTVILKDINLNVNDLNVVCYTGESGSVEQNCSSLNLASQNNIIKTYTKRALKSYEGLTVAATFPKNQVAVLEPKKYIDPEIIVMYLWALVGLLAYLYIFYIIYLWIKERINTNKKQKIVAAWFEAPKTNQGKPFSPAETSFLVNKLANHRSLTSTLISLAQRGYIKIVVENKKNVSFIKRKSWDADNKVLDYEKSLLNAMFDSEEITTTAKLKKSYKFSTKVPEVYKKIQTDAYTEGLFTENPYSYLMKTRFLLFVATIATLPLFGLPFALLAWFLTKGSLQKTDLGIEKYSEAQSLLNFLKSQKEQLNFQSHNQMFFEKLLPYATAFGVEKVWAEKFKDLQFTKSDWYEGGSSLNSTAFAHSLGSLNRSFSTMTSTRSSSGFSSGSSGGSSVGGGGVGGGGSW